MSQSRRFVKDDFLLWVVNVILMLVWFYFNFPHFTIKTFFIIVIAYWIKQLFFKQNSQAKSWQNKLSLYENFTNLYSKNKWQNIQKVCRWDLEGQELQLMST